jgi:chromosome segregation ATPase
MQRNAKIAVTAVVILLVGAIAALFVKDQKTSADYVAMKASEEAARTRYSQTIDAIAEIQDSLNAISVGDTSVVMKQRSLEAEQQGSNNQEALDRIAMLRESIERSKQRIRQLESSLSKNGMKVKGLEKMVANLKKDVEEKEAQVAELSGRVENLQTQVAGLETQVQEKSDTLVARDQTIEERRRELATVFVAVGNKKELSTKGVITAKGGVLGMGKTIQPTGKVSDAAYTAIDTDLQTVVPTTSKQAKVVSAQPPGSYELVLVDGRMELHILDPVQFRKVRQLVIVTA